MLNKRTKSILVAILITMGVTGCSSANTGDTGANKSEVSKSDKIEEKSNDNKKEENTEDDKWPSWANPVKVELDETIKYYRPSVRYAIKSEDIKNEIGKLRYLVENTEISEEYPNHYYWVYTLGDGLMKLGEYDLANEYLSSLLPLADDTLVMSYKRGDEIKSYTKSDYKMDDRVKVAIAKNKALMEDHKDIIEMSENFEIKDIQQGNMLAFALGRIGENEKAYEVYNYIINPDNFKEHGALQTAPANISAAAYAYLQGEFEKAIEITEPFSKLGIDSLDERYFGGYEGGRLKYARRHWNASFTQTEAYRELSKSGKVVDFKNLQDGDYSGKMIGYMGTDVTVDVKVDAGKITEIAVKQEEPMDDRSGGAFDIISDRIIKEQSLDVDMITGATLSSEAVRLGVIDALTGDN